MKLTSLLPIGLLSTTLAAECKEKTAEDVCENRVQVSVTDFVSGLIDDVPDEVYEAFVEASAQCMSCVSTSDVKYLSETADDTVLSYLQCKIRGCWCCTHDWCQHGDGTNFCPEQCYDDFPTCGPDDDAAGDDTAGRRLAGGTSTPTAFTFEVDVCMDDMTPLDSSATSYVDPIKMLDDFQAELAACYADKDAFMSTWSGLCADSGIDLSLMARRSDSGDSETMLLGVPGIDAENFKLTTYDSSDSHRSTSHMIFYSALGFAALSAFAVFGTAVVVKVVNKRSAAKAEQDAKWIAELSSVEVVSPINSQSSA
jgi:hypothetical protein